MTSNCIAGASVDATRTRIIRWIVQLTEAALSLPAGCVVAALGVLR